MQRKGRSWRWLGFRRLALTGACLAALALGSSFTASAAETQSAPSPYAVLAPLIGEWDVGPTGGDAAFVENFSWGPARSYIWVNVSLNRPAGEKHLHFEGMVVWNAATKRFDYLFVVEPGSLSQETGEFRLEADGTIVRDVVLTAPSGKTANFKQTFRLLEADRIETSLMRQTVDGWTATFPGSDRLTMVRSGKPS